MFYYIEGKVAEIDGTVAAIDCGGVGFALNVSLNTLSQLTAGEKVKLYVSESVREDAFELFGFYTKAERSAFELLIGVSGVGPKAALSMLSASTPESLAMAILAGDEKALTIAPGIGKKIAQRIIYELRDKVAKESGGAEVRIPAASVGTSAGHDKLSDAAAALAVLGYGTMEINMALKGVDVDTLDTEGIIKASLKNMVK